MLLMSNRFWVAQKVKVGRAFGGFVGPYLIGNIKERTGEFAPGLVILAGSLVTAAVIVLTLRATTFRRSPDASPRVAG